MIDAEERDHLASDLAIPITQLAGLLCGMRKYMGADGAEWLSWITSLDEPVNELAAVFEAALDGEGDYERVLAGGRWVTLGAQPDGIAAAERKSLAMTLEALRQQVQQERDLYYEQACEHSEMAGHEVQEARAAGRVAAYDELLAILPTAAPREGCRQPGPVARYPLTCRWCRNSPADHVAVYDYRPRAGAPERITAMLCGPCGHSVTILPAAFERWWLFRLTSDGENCATECDRRHALETTS
jgi:hypothetical protein